MRLLYSLPGGVQPNRRIRRKGYMMSAVGGGYCQLVWRDGRNRGLETIAPDYTGRPSRETSADRNGETPGRPAAHAHVRASLRTILR